MAFSPLLPQHKNTELLPEQAKARIEAGALLLDVREPGEFASARIPGAVLLPMSELQQRLAEIPHDREVVVYCRSGNRSAQVVDALISHLGYTNLYNLTGGIISWYRCNLPIDTQPVEDTYHATRYEDIDVLEAQRRLAASRGKTMLVDVREPFEFSMGRVPGAVNVPLNTLPQRLTDLRAAAAVLLVCASGNRSAIAAEWLMQQGLQQVANIEGGVNAWVRHGLALER